MPRDASGTFTLPAGNPVSSASLIESTWANTTMADLAAEMSDSLSRSGNGGMLVPFRLASGLEASPSLSFTADTVTGRYLANNGDMRDVVSGTDVGRWTSSGLELWNGTAFESVLTTSYIPSAASTTGKGIIEVADDAEAIAGTETLLATAPAGVKAHVDARSGAGNGLDADKLDGQHGSFYQSASNLNAGTVNSARLPTGSTSVKGASEHATNAETYAGTASRVVSAASLVGAFNDNAFRSSTRVVQELPGGFILQGGRQAGEGAVTFQETFSTAPICLVGNIERASASGWSDLNLNFSPPTTTGFTAYIPNGDLPFYWFAIGK